MIYTIQAPKTINATIDLPASKSMSNRALLIAALAGRKHIPQNLSDCDDTDVMIRALRDMPDVIDIKAAGTAMRFLTAYLAAQPGTHIITGTARMKQRPIGVLVDALRHLGAKIEYTERQGFPPLRITGTNLEGGDIEIAGNVSSQYISALLMMGPAMKRGLRLHLTGNIISRPYIDLTLWMMGEFVADAGWEDAKTITVAPTPYTPREYTIENDWSAASYWYEMIALAGAGSSVTLTGLADGSKQGDSTVRYIFSLLGVKTTFNKPRNGQPSTVTLTHTPRRIPRFEYDLINCPDLAQTIITTCAALGVPFHFTGLQTLKIKETDRIEALKTELRKVGIVIHDIDGKEMAWTGERCETQAQPIIDTYDDHRMALAFAPLSLVQQNIKINNPGVVTKSYPHYWKDLEQCGFSLQQS